MFRILIADDHSIVRKSVRQILSEGFPDAEIDAVVAVVVGAAVSTTSALFAASEPAEPGEASVKTALFVDASLIVPPFNASAEVAR